MVKLVCPACGWSDFLKYKGDSSWHCQCCGMVYSDAEVKTFEKEVPESEYNGYGVTIIDPDKEAFYDEFIANYDAYYAKYVTAYAKEDEEEKDESDWEKVEGPTPFD